MAARITRIRYGSGGGDVIDFTDPNSGYVIVTDGYRPTVAKRKRGALGGERHTRVDDTMLLMVSGDAETEANDRVDLLSAVIDQAQQWRDGPAVHVVTIEYRIEGSVLANPLQAAITGQPSGGDVVQLPFSYDSATSSTVIGSADDPLIFSFKRRGLWLGDEESRSRSGSANFNPGVMTPSGNFTDALAVAAPYKLSITWNNLTGPPGANAMIFTASNTGRLVLLQGEDETGGTNFTSAADADASGGDVGRYTPADTNANTANWNITIDNDVRMVYVVAHLKNRSTTISYNVRAHINGGSYGRMHTIDASNNDPQLIGFGPLVSANQAITSLELEITASGTGSSANSLDIDTIAVLAVEDTSTVLAVSDLADAAISPVIDHALLTRPKPLVTESSVGMTYNGTAYLWNIGNTAAALVLGGTATSWRIRDDVAAALQIGASWVRRPAYLVPR
jgi:hypothetical protein